MKLKLSGVGILVVLAAMSMGSVGCGPGLSHRSVAYSAQDVLAAMDKELASSIPGTATLTSGTMELPETRMPVSAALPQEPLEPLSPPVQTWGVAEPAEQPHEKSIYEP